VKNRALIYTLVGLLATGTGSVFACDYTAGETKFKDYADCRYGPDNVLVVDLPESSSWEQCIYHLQAFRPETLLAITMVKDGQEVLSVSKRGQIGNPCYLNKQQCDKALKAYWDANP
jgi:hypothetical protein